MQYRTQLAVLCMNLLISHDDLGNKEVLQMVQNTLAELSPSPIRLRSGQALTSPITPSPLLPLPDGEGKEEGAIYGERN
jgi:hypothetical protein